MDPKKIDHGSSIFTFPNWTDWGLCLVFATKSCWWWFHFIIHWLVKLRRRHQTRLIVWCLVYHNNYCPNTMRLLCKICKASSVKFRVVYNLAIKLHFSGADSILIKIFSRKVARVGVTRLYRGLKLTIQNVIYFRKYSLQLPFQGEIWKYTWSAFTADWVKRI